MGNMLHALLADQFAVSARMRNCRWNATGSQELRRLFASHDEVLGEMMDEIGQCAPATGNNQTATLAAFLNVARAKAHPGEPPRASEIMSELLAGHEAAIGRLRENLERCLEMRGELITRDFLSAMIEKHQRMATDLQIFTGETHQRRANGRAHQPPEAQPTSCVSI